MSGKNALREVLTGAALRAIAGISDAGELALARIERLGGGDHIDTQGEADVWVHVVDALSGLPVVGRLFIPGNVLFAAADLEAGDTVMVASPRDARGPGLPYVLHGDAGDNRQAGQPARVPNWLRTKVGLFTRKVLRLESSALGVEVECPAGQTVKLGAAATKKVAREGDSVRVTFPAGTTFALSTGGTATLSNPVTCNGTITSGSVKVRAED